MSLIYSITLFTKTDQIIEVTDNKKEDVSPYKITITANKQPISSFRLYYKGSSNKQRLFFHDLAGKLHFVCIQPPDQNDGKGKQNISLFLDEDEKERPFPPPLL